MPKVVTVEVIKSHDGIQCGRVLRHTEAPWLIKMITDGYYKVVSDTEVAEVVKKPTRTKKPAKK